MNTNCIPRLTQMKGFSLLEMLVALIILSICLGVLYQASATAIRNVSIAEQYTKAVMLAESMLAASSYVTQEELALEGSFEEFRWEISSWPVPMPAAQAGRELPVEGLPLQYLEVWVSWQGRSSEREIDLLTIVPLQMGDP